MSKSKNTKNNKKAKGLTKTEKKEVKSIMHSDREDKVVSYTSGLISHNAAITSADCLRVIPLMAPGILEGQRVGNEILIKRLNLQCLLNKKWDLSYDESKIGVRLMVFSVKSYPTYSGAVANAAQWERAMLRDGTNVRAFTGTVKSFFLPYNSDVITMHEERRFVLTNPYQQNSSVIPSVSNTPFAVDPHFSTKYLSFDLKCKNKSLKYSATQTGAAPNQSPNNYSPMIAVGYCKLNGSAPDVLAQGLEMDLQSTLYYEDP